MRRLSQKQLGDLRFIADHIREFERPPTIREVAAGRGSRYFGLSTKAANDKILALERRGLITRIPKSPRGIKVTNAGHDALLPERAHSVVDGRKHPYLRVAVTP